MDVTGADDGTAAPRGVFSVPRTLKWWTIGLLGLNAALDLASMLPAWATLGIIAKVRAEQGVDADTVALIDSCAALIGLANVGAYVATAVVFCCWFYRINANARLLTDEKPPMSPGMAVGGFFIPIACLYMPYRAAGFSWKVSARVAYPEGGGPRAGLVGGWWTAWIAGNIVGQIVFKQALRSAMGDEEPTLDQIAFQQYGSILLSAATVLTATLCIAVVKRLTDLQARIAAGAAADGVA